MFKSLTPIILIGVAVVIFFMFTNPMYAKVQELQKQVAGFNDAISNAQDLQSVRDELSAKYNSFPPESLNRLVKLLPDNVNNIRLILDIKGIADKYGLQIQNVKFDPAGEVNPTQVPQSSKGLAAQTKDYGVFNFEFSTTGSYNSFVKFVADMEKSLRIIDINSINFASSDASSNYRYDFKITTYWLKH